MMAFYFGLGIKPMLNPASSRSEANRISAAPAEYWRTWIAAFLFFGGFYALLVPLPLYLAACQFADWQIGTILGAFGVAALVGRPLAGVCADTWGRQPLMLLGTLALVVGAGSVPFTKAAAPLFTLRIIQAAGYVAFTTAATTRVSDLVGPERKGSALALFGVSVNLAMTITPMLVNAALDTITVSGAFGVWAGLAAVAGLLSLGRAAKPQMARSGARWTVVFQLLASLGPAAAAAAHYGVGFGAFFQFLPLLAQRRSIPAMGSAYAMYGVAIIATRIATGRWQDKPDRRWLLWPGFLACAAGLYLLGWADSVTVLLLGAVLVAIGGGIVHPGLMASHIELVAEEQRGRAMATFYLAFDLGIGVGTWL